LLAGLGSGIYGGVEEVVSITQSLGGYIVEPEKTKSRFYYEVFKEVYCPIAAEIEYREDILRRTIKKFWRS
ncbi:MAG: hypothetical protein ACP5Q4_06220, partial [Candidatus Caldatribacteriaceae bacterium]